MCEVPVDACAGPGAHGQHWPARRAQRRVARLAQQPGRRAAQQAAPLRRRAQGVCVGELSCGTEEGPCCCGGGVLRVWGPVVALSAGSPRDVVACDGMPCVQGVTEDAIARLFRRFPGMEYCDLKKERTTGKSKVRGAGLELAAGAPDATWRRSRACPSPANWPGLSVCTSRLPDCVARLAAWCVRAQGYCYINYSTPDAAASAVEQLNGIEFPPHSGHRIKVRVFLLRRARCRCCRRKLTTHARARPTARPTTHRALRGASLDANLSLCVAMAAPSLLAGDVCRAHGRSQQRQQQRRRPGHGRLHGAHHVGAHAHHHALVGALVSHLAAQPQPRRALHARREHAGAPPLAPALAGRGGQGR